MVISELGGNNSCEASTGYVVVTVATPPVVNFVNTTTTTICAGDTVTFEATVGGAGTFNYYFYINAGPAAYSVTGTTSTSIQFDPVANAGHTMANGDNFWVVVENSDSCQTASVSRTITVAAPPAVVLTTSVDFPGDVFCTGEDVDFIATNIGGATYEYEVGSGGRVAVGSSSFTIPYAQLAGTATVTVYVTTGSCVSTDTVFVQENIISSAGTITGTQTICPGDTPTDLTSTAGATASGTITYRWERQAVTANPATDPWTTIGINSTTHSFSGTLSETTRFRRMVISELGGNNSCEASTGYVVVTVATPPVVNFTNTTTTTICAGDTVTFEATVGGAGTFNYYFYINGGPAAYSVTGTTSTSIQFDPVANAGHTMANGDNFWVVVENSDSCQTTSVSRTITVAAPPAVVLTTSVDFPGDVFCTGEDVDFIATNIGGATYEYEIGSGGRVAVGSSSFTIPYAQLAGTATVTVYVTTGSCVSTDTVFVQENIISSAGTITGTQTICPGDTPTDLTSTAGATASGTITYRWERQAVTSNPATDPWTTIGINSTTHSFSGTLSETTRFRRMVISELGGNNSCEASTGYVVVTVATPPVVNFVNTTTTTICAGDTVTFEATVGGAGTFNYYFYINGGPAAYSVTGTTSTSIQFDPVANAGHTMANGDNFWVVVENSDSCQTTSVSRTITVAAPPAVVLTTSVDFPGDVFCTGEDVDFIATNIGGATYEYEIGSGGRVAVGSSSFTIPYAQLAGTATVTVYVTTGSCVSTDTVFVQENIISSAGTITGTQTICPGDTPTDLTSTAGATASGTITYRWERQAVTSNPATDPWTTIGINSTTHSFSGTLSETTRFRRMVISELGGNNSCEASTGYVVVTVATPPVVNFVNTTTTTICAGDTVTFEATVGGAGTFNYYFYINGGPAAYSVTGTTSTSIQFDPVANAGHTMANGDNYFWVVVENSDSCQTTSVSRTITVAAPPAVVLTTSVDFPGDVFCTGEDVDFIATNIGGATYEYEIGSGGRVAVGSSSFTIPYAQLAGTATVTVYVTTGSCVSTDTVFVQENIISSAGTITGTQTICPGDTPTDLTSTAGATASGTISYVWERQPISQNPATDPWTRTSVTSAGYSFSGTISESTRFRRVTISNLSGKDCEETTSFVVVTLATPTAVNFVNTTTTTICAGDTVSFEATAGGGGAPFNYEFYANGGITAVHSYTGTTSTLVTFDPVSDASLVLNNGDYFYVVVTDNNGCQTTSASRTITVSAPPAVILTTSVDFPGDVFCTGEDVDFIATNIGGATYEYEIGSGGRVAVGSSSFTIPYVQLAGTATVTVYVTTGSCVSTDTVFVQENIISSAGTITGTQTICPGDTPTDLTSTAGATASGTISYVWDRQAVTANPATDPWTRTSVTSAGYSFSGTISESTRFRRVTISNLSGKDCEETTSFVVVTLATPPAVNFVNTTTTTICAGDTVSFEATAGGGGAPFNYEFYANGGITAVHSYTGTTSTLVTFDPVSDASLVLNNGDYFYVVVTDNNGCQTTSASRTITVSAPPAVILTTSVDFPGDVFCTGEDVDFIATNIGGATYEYEVGSGGRVAVGSSSFTIPYVQLAGTATVTVYVPTGSCVSTDTVFVQENIISSAGTITGTQTICPGDTPTDLTSTAGATASGTISYVWERQPVSQNPATDPWTRTSVTSAGYSFSGTISESTRFRRVTISNLSGKDCEETTSFVVVTLATPPAANFVNTTTTTICAGDTVTFEATAGGGGGAPFNYEFYANGGITAVHSYTGTTSTLVTFDPVSDASLVLNNGDYFYVVVTDNNGCQTTSASRTITVSAPPALQCGGDVFCTGEDVDFIATNIGGATYEYEIGSGGRVAVHRVVLSSICNYSCVL